MSTESFMSREQLLGCAKDIVAAFPGARVQLADGTEVGSLSDGTLFIDEHDDDPPIVEAQTSSMYRINEDGSHD